MAKYFLIAGEASGDQHAARLMRAIAECDGSARFAGLGGDAMRGEGACLYQDYRKMAYMVVADVVRHIGTIRRNFRIAREALRRERPDVLILIDYPSFNLRMAAFCRKHLPGTKIVWYIPPKVWAWKTWRIHRIARLSDQVLGIFPFEPAFYARYGYRCRYVGNPTAEEVGLWQQTHPAEAREDMIAILPGSRKSEIRHCLPTMLRAAERVNAAQGGKYRILIAGAPGIDRAFYQPLAGGREVVFGETYALLSQARAAVVNSGTATLEAALLGCPQVPVYYLACSWIAHFRPLLFRSPYFTLPNILMQREVVREKIAYRFTEAEVAGELSRLLTDEAVRGRMLADYAAIADRLGVAAASSAAAAIITSGLLTPSNAC